MIIFQLIARIFRSNSIAMWVSVILSIISVAVTLIIGLNGDSTTTAEGVPDASSASLLSAGTFPSASALPADTDARDGRLAFTVTDVRCGESEYRSIFAAGPSEELCIVDVAVHNSGSGGYFVNDTGRIYGESSQPPDDLTPISTGRPERRQLVFRVPAGTEPSELDYLTLRDPYDDDGMSGVYIG
jgi:hypothetical protein